MAYASFHQQPEPPLKQNDLTSGGLSESKAIAKIYGYMAIGLLISGLVAFFGAWLFSSQINRWLSIGIQQGVERADAWAIALIVVWVVSFIALIVLSFVIPMRVAKGGKSLWVPYILYSFFMGILLTAVLLAGISFWIIGEAFLITSLGFVGMFLIGWRAKSVTIPGYMAALLGVGILVVGIAGLLVWLFGGMTVTDRFWFDIGINAAIVALLFLITIIDTFRIKKIIANSGNSENIYLYCAYVMYCDFIAILVRVIYLIARTQRR